MQTVLTIFILGILILLTIKNKIKINIVTLFLFSLVGISLFNLIVKDEYNKVSFIKMETPDQISEIWENYSNSQLSNDVQLTRTLNPYHVLVDDLKEPNQVITDNKNIYSISGNKVVITNAGNLKIIHEIKYIGQAFTPLFLYVTEDKLIVLGEVNSKTRCYIYDINGFKEFKNFEINATYITSRLINDELYVISSKIIENQKKDRPSYTENGMTKYIPFEQIYYVNDTYSNNYVNVIKTNINDKQELAII